MNQTITLYSSFYGQPEPFNPDIFGSARGLYNCVLFTDDQNLHVPDGISVVVDRLVGLDPNRSSRRAKLMPHRYLAETDWSIYIDNNMQILADPKCLIETLKGRREFLFATKHPSRECAYAEADACISAKKDDPKTIQYQMQVYRDHGFPENNGLIHCGFLVRRHNQPGFPEFGDHWFEHVLAYSRRDQLSVEFIAWKLGIKIGCLAESHNQKPLFDWPVFSDDIRRDYLNNGTKKRMKRISNMILKRGFFNKITRRRN